MNSIKKIILASLVIITTLPLCAVNLAQRTIPSLTQKDITFLQQQGVEQEIITALIQFAPFLEQFVKTWTIDEQQKFWKEFDEANNVPLVLITYFIIFENLAQANPEMGWDDFIDKTQGSVQ